MKWGCAAIALIVVLVTAFAAYEFFTDMELGGMPRKEIDVAFQSKCGGQLSTILDRYASDHGFGLQKGQTSIYLKQKLGGLNDFFYLTRWNAQVIVSQHHEQCGEGLLCYYSYIEYKGWLWWTDAAQADRLADDLVSDLKKSPCLKRASITVNTNSLR
jgi:hypothetical protein